MSTSTWKDTLCFIQHPVAQENYSPSWLRIGLKPSPGTRGEWTLVDHCSPAIAGMPYGSFSQLKHCCELHIPLTGRKKLHDSKWQPPDFKSFTDLRRRSNSLVMNWLPSPCPTFRVHTEHISIDGHGYSLIDNMHHYQYTFTTASNPIDWILSCVIQESETATPHLVQLQILADTVFWLVDSHWLASTAVPPPLTIN